MIAYAQMGDANASIPTPQPMLPRPMFGAYGVVPAQTSAGVRGAGRDRRDAGRPDRRASGRSRRWPTPARWARRTCRCNDALPRIEVEPDTFTVRIDGEVVEPDPVTELPMAQRYFLF